MGDSDPFFRAMTEGTAEHWRRIAEKDSAFSRKLPEWILLQLEMLRDDCHGFAIDRLEHCLQTATRAHRDGRDEEYVVCALVHDIGAMLAPANHAEFIAMIMAPYVSPENRWMLHHHGLFQSYYFAHFFGGDRDARDRFRDHPLYGYTLEFCRAYDQAGFDPDYRSMTLAEFEPMLRRVLARPRS
ncbi:MAG: phosphohydrolase [Sphingomonadales bacterium]|nr:MAG: phosphohydrolase [Sphingomonadales bacterium]